VATVDHARLQPARNQPSCREGAELAKEMIVIDAVEGLPFLLRASMTSRRPWQVSAGEYGAADPAAAPV
jgi:hypothetical protein